MTRKQVIRALIKDYERAIKEGWGEDKLDVHKLDMGICWASEYRYGHTLDMESYGHSRAWLCITPVACEDNELILNSLTARLFLLNSLND